MAMFMVKPWYILNGPDDCFNPVTHIATERNFIKFLQFGVYDSRYIGYKVQLSNTAAYNNGLWVIADVNHDSSQPNTYDLISQDCFNAQPFDDGPPYQYWRDSTLRTWVNGTLYDGFSTDFKTKINNIRYDSNGASYNDDKVVVVSCTELCNGNQPSFVVTEGTPYPIFPDEASRSKHSFESGQNKYWTRSRYINNDTGVVPITDYGHIIGWVGYSATIYEVVPILRVS